MEIEFNLKFIRTIVHVRTCIKSETYLRNWKDAKLRNLQKKKNIE